MAIHTLSIGGSDYEIQPKYASSAGYATTASNAVAAHFATNANTAVTASNAINANTANQAATVIVRGSNTSTNYPLLLAASVAVTAGAVKGLFTDTANSLYYNPSSNILTVPSFKTSAIGVSGAITIYGGSDFNLRASSTTNTNPGDLVFQNSSGTELGRIWLDGGSVFSLRYGSSDTTKKIIHEGNINDYLPDTTNESLTILTGADAGDEHVYDGSTPIQLSDIYYAYNAGTATNAVTAGSAVTAGIAVTAGNAVTAGRASYASSATYATTAAHAVTAGMSKATWTNVSTSTFYIAGSTTSTSGSNTLIKNTNVKVESNSVRASGGFYETSDARLKTITNDVEVDFERLKSIPKIQYIKKGETAPHIGTIAQDLQKIYPEFVETGDDGYMLVDYAKLSIIPLKAVDLLYDEVNKLKDELKTVKEENQMLKDRLDNIEAIINK